MICFKCEKEVKNFKRINDIVLCITCDKKTSEKLLNVRDQLIGYLREIVRWDSLEKFVLWREIDKNKVRAKLFTKDNCYSIVAIGKDRPEKGSYMGCQVSIRKPRAGEDWIRGNDLADGDFSHETWEKIKNDIIAFELVRVSQGVRKSKVIEKTDEVKVSKEN